MRQDTAIFLLFSLAVTEIGTVTKASHTCDTFSEPFKKILQTCNEIKYDNSTKPSEQIFECSKYKFNQKPYIYDEIWSTVQSWCVEYSRVARNFDNSELNKNISEHHFNELERCTTDVKTTTKIQDAWREWLQYWRDKGLLPPEGVLPIIFKILVQTLYSSENEAESIVAYWKWCQHEMKTVTGPITVYIETCEFMMLTIIWKCFEPIHPFANILNWWYFGRLEHKYDAVRKDHKFLFLMTIHMWDVRPEGTETQKSTDVSIDSKDRAVLVTLSSDDDEPTAFEEMDLVGFVNEEPVVMRCRTRIRQQMRCVQGRCIFLPMQSVFLCRCNHPYTGEQCETQSGSTKKKESSYTDEDEAVFSETSTATEPAPMRIFCSYKQRISARCPIEKRCYKIIWSKTHHTYECSDMGLQDETEEASTTTTKITSGTEAFFISALLRIIPIITVVGFLTYYITTKRPIEDISPLNNEESNEAIRKEIKEENEDEKNEEENKDENKAENKAQNKAQNKAKKDENKAQNKAQSKDENANTSSNIREFSIVFWKKLKTKRSTTKIFQSLWGQTHCKRRVAYLVCFKITARVLTGFMTKGLAQFRKNILKALVLAKNGWVSNPNLL